MTSFRKRVYALGALGMLIALGLLVPSPTNAAQDNLIAASEAGDLAQVKALLAAKADANAKRADGQTALMLACQNSHLEVVQALLAARADVNARNDQGLTALMYTQDVASAKALITAGANVNAKDNNGATALLGAALRGDAGRVTALIAAGANVNAKDNTGWPPLMGAANKGCADCIKALIAAGAGEVVNAKDVSGTTALMYAAHSGNLDSVKALIAAGADVNAKNNRGITALVAATADDVVAFLRSEQSKANPTKATQASDAMADKEWDAIKDNLAPGPLRDFLGTYPHYRGVEEKKLYLSLEEQMEQIRVRKIKPHFSISFDRLPAQWSSWRKNYGSS